MSIAAAVQHLHKEFYVGDNRMPVLFDINVDVRMGELTMLVGPSGCGKTTLISIMSGILSPTSGDVTILGQSFAAMREREKALFRRKNIGLIFQQYNLLPALTAAENAALPLIAGGMDDEKAIAQARTLLETIGMEKHTERLPPQLSGGQQQRVAIARALVHNPKLIVCDEPTGALDAETGKAVMEILRDIANEKNNAVLIVTHDDRIYHFADRILEMSDGHIVGDDKPSGRTAGENHV